MGQRETIAPGQDSPKPHSDNALQSRLRTSPLLSQHISPRMVTHMNSRRTSFLVYMVLVCLVALSRVASGQITGVWLQSPQPGQNPNQVQVNAIAYGPSTVTGWIIYLDDLIVYRTNVPSGSISQQVNLTNGQHLLYRSKSVV